MGFNADAVLDLLSEGHMGDASQFGIPSLIFVLPLLLLLLPHSASVEVYRGARRRPTAGLPLRGHSQHQPARFL